MSPAASVATVGDGRGGPGSRRVVAATAPAGLAEVLDGPERTGHVLATSARVAQLALDDGRDRTLLVLAARGGVALPNTLLCVADAAPARGLRAGQAVLVGGGRVRIGDDLVVRVARWRDHRVPLGRVAPAVVAARLATASPPPTVDPALVEPFAALLATAPGGVPDPVGLLGLGIGSTPEGDDLVAGLVAGGLVLGRAVGAPTATAWAMRLAGAATAVATTTTTALSASLLEHAARGEVVTEAAAVLRALVGRGDLARAEQALAVLGHTSGRALVRGLRAAATLVVATADAAAGADAEETH